MVRTDLEELLSTLPVPDGALGALEFATADEMEQVVRHATVANTAVQQLLDVLHPYLPPAPPSTPKRPAAFMREPGAAVEAAVVYAPPPPARSARPVRRSTAGGSGLAATGEQDAIVEGTEAGDDLVVEAGAGTGKTTTLKMAAAVVKGPCLYLAYNRSIAAEARKSFPSGVDCRTAHSLAFRAVGAAYGGRLGVRVHAERTAQLLRILEPLRVNQEIVLSPRTLARLATEAVDSFCHSDAEEVRARHVPRLEGTTPQEMEALRAEVLPHARRLWEETQQVDSPHWFTHDYYLKLWALTRPELPYSTLMLDEAQDSNPVVASLVLGQDAQRIAVGDSSQSIYGWRGATNAMAGWPGKRLQLTQSWRFGPAIAEEANAWLAQIEGSIQLSGNPALDSQVLTNALDHAPDAILCYTNIGTVDHAMSLMQAGLRPALVGGGQHIRGLAEAAIQLQAGKPASHRELLAFSSWDQLREFTRTEAAGSDLKAFVTLIDTYTPEIVIQAVNGLVEEQRAGIILSTAHKAKGREWGTVYVASDFPSPRSGEDGVLDPPTREKAMLGYVTVTRAKSTLDNHGLAWIHQCADGPERRAAALDTPAATDGRLPTIPTRLR
ncbi:UvrD-helicase domain-containing protein [Streptomyces netropsis]|uniref:DNA 3'-5' helicase n=1 Tax=Streptomyces netropsis TaxID=55404 RepID=A0A7W7PHT0_STRNE|nr:UvrD-helicase domain-containing protein [Streptomyces netropsis]MBB4890389.1 hypothetical protein [Streptomyces netropsis]